VESDLVLVALFACQTGLIANHEVIRGRLMRDAVKQWSTVIDSFV
jgi:hypothetical protein